MKPAYKPIPTEQRKVIQGMMGERIVAHFLRKEGHVVEESLNPFDNKKDMLVDGLPCEVKTQVPIVVEDSFGVSPSQLPKIKNSHRVYWVSVPTSRNIDEYAGCIFEMDPAHEKLKGHRWSAHSGREAILFPRKQEAMAIRWVITDEDLLNQLKELSTSYL